MGMERDKLDSVVALHAQWLRSGGAAGRQADFEDADLRQADLRGADLSFATFTGANLERAELSGAVLRNAILRRVKMSYADLRGADLTAADLQQAVAEGVDLTGATLDGAIMVAARLDHSRLRSADLIDAVAASVSFRRCDLSDAKLARAELDDANLDHANLAGASFASDAERLFAATLSFRARAGGDGQLGADRRTLAAQSRQLQLTLTLQTAALWLAVAGIVGCLFAGATDLALVAWHRSFAAVSGFNYFAALGISLVGILIFAALSFSRSRTMAELRRYAR